VLEFKRGTPSQAVQLVAVVSLLISSKYLEKSYPGVMKLNELIKSPFEYEDYMALEQQMMERLHWNLTFTTTYDFIQHFLCQGILFSTDKIYNSGNYIAPGMKAAAFAKQYAEFFSIMCQQNHSFLQYEPLTLACGIIMAARKMIRIKQKWSSELQAMIEGRVKESKIKRCMAHIFEYYEETFPDHALRATVDLDSDDEKENEIGLGSGN